MTDRRPRLAGLLLASLTVAGCGSTAPPPSSSAAATAAGSSAASVPPTVAPSEPAPDATVVAAGQTDTEWGRIWDTLPSGFPMYPGATPSEEASSDPASAVYVADDAEPRAIATWFQDAFEVAAFHTDALSGPFEDGGYLLESSGDDPACRVSLTIAPLGGTTSMTVLYGADCPHD